MKTAIQRAYVHTLLAQRNGYLVLAVGMTVACVVLSVTVFCLLGRERIVVTPPVLHRSFWVDNRHVSPDYLAEMTSFFAQLRLTKTPSNAAYQREALLRYTDPRYYGVLKNALVAEDDRLAAAHTSVAFYPVAVAVDSNHLTVRMSGDVVATVGDAVLPAVRVTYKVRYRYLQGRLWVDAFVAEKAEKKGEEHAQ